MRYRYVGMDTIFFCIIITLAEHGINKTLEILSTEVMAQLVVIIPTVSCTKVLLSESITIGLQNK